MGSCSLSSRCLWLKSWPLKETIQRKHAPSDKGPYGISAELMDTYVKSCGESTATNTLPPHCLGPIPGLGVGDIKDALQQLFLLFLLKNNIPCLNAVMYTHSKILYAEIAPPFPGCKNVNV